MNKKGTSWLDNPAVEGGASVFRDFLHPLAQSHFCDDSSVNVKSDVSVERIWFDDKGNVTDDDTVSVNLQCAGQQNTD